MLRGLSIRDVVLIDRLDLPLDPGLLVLTGETGAGKSILLDSLGLIMGARADSRLVRPGADRCAVVAEIGLAANHPARRLLDDQGLADDEELLILRRVVGADGRSRAFVNDQPVSAGFLRQLTATLFEVHGQHGEQGLLDTGSHRALLDGYGDLENLRGEVAGVYHHCREVEANLAEARAALAAARADEDYLRHVVDELDRLAPHAGEEAALAEARTLAMHGEKLAEAMAGALSELDGEDGVDARLRRAARVLDAAAGLAAGRLDGAVQALERAVLEAGEAIEALGHAQNSAEFDPRGLEAVEERLFALRAAARKHGCEVDDLPALRDRFAARLADVEQGSLGLHSLEDAAAAARADFRRAAARLSAARAKAARRLDQAVMRELKPLKLEKALFETRLEPLDEGAWTANGAERVRFMIATNPGSRPGPLARIASGGELSRIMLALRVVLAGRAGVATMIFDEVDRGIGGAVADAVGERLARLAEDAQVLVVTHSPQVAARANTHWRIDKRSGDNGAGTYTIVEVLDEVARHEEIARMLAGARITKEARAAARSLIRS